MILGVMIPIYGPEDLLNSNHNKVFLRENLIVLPFDVFKVEPSSTNKMKGDLLCQDLNYLLMF